MRSTDLSEADFEKTQLEYKEFNARCSEELKEMNQNRITNIIERGGVEGWDTVIVFILICYRLLTYLTLRRASHSSPRCRLSTSFKEWVCSALRKIITLSGQSLTGARP